MPTAAQFLTHTVDNQAPPLRDLNVYASDLALREAVAREGGGWGEADLFAYGATAGGELMELGVTANENKPKPKLFDRYGHRLDEVEFHPAYHRIMALGIWHGVVWVELLTPLATHMKQSTVLADGEHQAVLLPDALALSASVSRVDVIAIGRTRIIAPSDEGWDSWFDAAGVSPDFMAAPKRLAGQNREAF